MKGKLTGKKKVREWVLKNQLEIAIFNLFVIILFILRSVGYFDPYLTLSANVVVFILLVLIFFLFKARSEVYFIVALLFWLFASSIKFLGVDLWAERTSVYVFESISLGMVALILEQLKLKSRMFGDED